MCVYVCMCVCVCVWCLYVCVWDFNCGFSTIYIGLMWFVGTWMVLVGCFGGALCMGLGRPYGCEAAFADPSYFNESIFLLRLFIGVGGC